MPHIHILGKHTLLEEPKFTVEDEEAEGIQRLKGTAVKQDEQQTAEVQSGNFEIDSTPGQINLPQEWRVPIDLSLHNVIGQIH